MHVFKTLSKKEMILREFAIGMSSEVDIKRDLHILFVDFDEIGLEQVEESVREMQQFWRLSDAFIYETKNGYHAYFYYDVMPYSRVVMILNYAKYVDDKFRYISRYYDYKTIRQAGKYKVRDIKFVETIVGIRSPSMWEAQVGDMKRMEREELSKMHAIFNTASLKD